MSGSSFTLISSESWAHMFNTEDKLARIRKLYSIWTQVSNIYRINSSTIDFRYLS